MNSLATILPKQEAPGKFWIPGETLDDEYSVPTSEELVHLWNEHMGVSNGKATEGVYGVYTPPTRDIKMIASIDLCEVLRLTQKALYAVTGVEAGHDSNYSSGTWYDPAKVGVPYERSIVVSTVRVLLRHNLVQPVDGMDHVRDMLKLWRSSGVWIVANTSTLPGCEEPTIKNTLASTAGGNFDGIIFPRNHDGEGSVTKASALRAIIKEAGIKPELPILHIDDANYHHKSFKDEATSFLGATFLLAPTYDNKPVPHAHSEFDSPLETFIGASNLLKHLGVTNE